jgi:hypothetical protein
MDAPAMLRHMRAALALSLGELEVPRLVPIWIGVPVGWLFVHVLRRWPRSLGGRNPPLPALHPPPDEAGFEEERALLLAALRRFVASLRAEPDAQSPHPIFGRMTRAEWARVHALHLEHHLRQFAS